MARSFKAVRHHEKPGWWIVRHPELNDCHFGLYDNRRAARRQARGLRYGERWWQRKVVQL
jgi:hypothetical protein